MRLPYITTTAGVDGAFKACPEDFRVDEIPAYSPSGSGDHCFARIQKRDLTTQEAIKRLARALDIEARDVGYAGLKDRQAITTQWVSLPGISPDQAIGCEEVEGLEVLEAHAHSKKLRTGHLRGNSFRIRVRCEQPDMELVRSTVEQLRESGLPNYFGEQRFGFGGRNVEEARAWLVDGGRPPRQRFKRRLLVSALQSEAFNRCVAERVSEGRLGIVELGDLVKKTDSGGLFVAEDLEEVQTRCKLWQVSPTGPMFGAKMRWPESDAKAREERLMADSGLGPESLKRMGKLGEGTRREVRVALQGLEIVPDEQGFFLCFELPAGSYATVVLREILKTPENDGT